MPRTGVISTSNPYPAGPSSDSAPGKVPPGFQASLRSPFPGVPILKHTPSGWPIHGLPRTRYRHLMRSRRCDAIAGSLLIGAAMVLTSCGSGIAGQVEPDGRCPALLVRYEALVADLLDEVGGAPIDEILSVPRMIAFVDDSLGQAEVAELMDEVRSWDRVRSVVYFSKDEALAEFRELFADQPALIERVEEDPSVLPASIRIIVDAGQMVSLQEHLVDTPGIRQVGHAASGWNDAAVAVAMAALEASDLASEWVSLQSDLEGSGRSLVELVTESDISGLEANGVVGELILDAALRGFVPLPP